MARAAVVNINDVLEGHIRLELDCLDRIYLNAYVNKLQVEGQVAYFLRDHLGNPVPSPALFEKIGNRFRAAVRAFAKGQRRPRTPSGGPRSHSLGRPQARPREAIPGSRRSRGSQWRGGHRRRPGAGVGLEWQEA